MNKDEIREVYETELIKVLNHDTSESDKQMILRTYTHKALSNMIMDLLGIPGRGNKIDKIWTIREFFESEKRTADLCKNLHYMNS